MTGTIIRVKNPNKAVIQDSNGQKHPLDVSELWGCETLTDAIVGSSVVFNVACPTPHSSGRGKTVTACKIT